MYIERRHILCDLLIRYRFPATKRQLIDRLNEMGHAISEKTLSRDLNFLEEYVDVHRQRTYDPNSGQNVVTYQLQDDQAEILRQELEEISRLRAFELLIRYLGKNSDVNDYISAGKGSHSGGYAWLSLLFEAMFGQHQITFNYTKYGESNPSMRVLSPYHVKLNDNVWYIIGKQENTNEIKVFGLDRVTELSILDIPFIRDPEFDPQEYFKNYLGVFTEGNRTPQLIELEIKEPFASRLKSKKLHDSQEILEETEGSMKIRVNVVPTSEFYTEILKLRSGARILSPEPVKNRMKEIVLEMMMGYE